MKLKGKNTKYYFTKRYIELFWIFVETGSIVGEYFWLDWWKCSHFTADGSRIAAETDGLLGERGDANSENHA